jgi:hypothetical protein
MLEAYYLKKVALELKLFVIKLVKCKESGILSSLQNTKTLWLS